MKRLTCILMLMGQPMLADVKTPQGRTIDCFCTDKSGRIGSDHLLASGRAHVHGTMPDVLERPNVARNAARMS